MVGVVGHPIETIGSVDPVVLDLESTKPSVASIYCLEPRFIYFIDGERG